MDYSPWEKKTGTTREFKFQNWPVNVIWLWIEITMDPDPRFSVRNYSIRERGWRIFLLIGM
jgi:hypothetical protein